MFEANEGAATEDERKAARQARAAAKRERRKGTLTRTLTCEIAKPLNRSWDELGTTLRALRKVAHVAINAAAIEHVMARTAYRAGDTERKANGYQAAKQAIAGFAEWAAQHSDESVRARFVELNEGVSSYVADSWAQMGKDAAQKWFKEHCATRIPSASEGAPIALRADGVKLRVIDGVAVLDMAIDPWRKRGPVEVVLAGSSGKHWAALRRAASGEAEVGAIKIVQKTGKKWLVLIAVTEPVERRPDVDPERALIVHRGMHNFLYALTTTGASRKLIRGEKLAAQKRVLAARRRSLGSVTRDERGDGAKGHGRARRYEAVSGLEDKEARIVRTSCQQAAAAAVRMATELGCGTLVIEQYGGIAADPDDAEAVETQRYLPRFPYYQLKQAVEWAAKRSGLAMKEVPAEYVSTTCPRCLAQSASFHRHRTGIFHCALCSFDRDADFVAAYWMGTRSGFSMEVWNERFERDKRLAAQARDESGSAPERGSEAEPAVTSHREREGDGLITVAAREAGISNDLQQIGQTPEPVSPPPRSPTRGHHRTARKAVRNGAKGQVV